jgi:hypothetical protein
MNESRDTFLKLPRFSLARLVCATAIAGLAVGLVVKYISDHTSLHVKIVNGESETLKDVKLSFRGGPEAIDVIQANETMERKIHVTGKSGMAISYTDIAGIKFNKEFDVYFPSGASGQLLITLIKQSVAHLKDDSQLGY